MQQGAAVLKLFPIETFVGVVEKNYLTIKDVVLNLDLTVVTALETPAALVHGFYCAASRVEFYL
jgi:hypothetical protein